MQTLRKLVQRAINTPAGWKIEKTIDFADFRLEMLDFCCFSCSNWSFVLSRYEVLECSFSVVDGIYALGSVLEKQQIDWNAQTAPERRRENPKS
jgi:hypothetical protein